MRTEICRGTVSVPSGYGAHFPLCNFEESFAMFRVRVKTESVRNLHWALKDCRRKVQETGELVPVLIEARFQDGIPGPGGFTLPQLL